MSPFRHGHLEDEYIPEGSQVTTAAVRGGGAALAELVESIASMARVAGGIHCVSWCWLAVLGRDWKKCSQSAELGSGFIKLGST